MQPTVASVGPSIASIYGRKLRLDGSACLAISQSGKSPDIVAMAETARAGRLRHSLWTGDIGLAIFLWDCLHETPRFPTLDVFFAGAAH